MIPFNKGLFKAPKYSSFELHHDNKLSFGIGDLVPIYHNIMIPGDRFRTDVGFLTRFAPMLAPVMQRFDLTIDWHFVPMRLILGERRAEEFFNLHNPDNSGTLPSIAAGDYFEKLGRKNLLDYLGYPQFDNFLDAFKRSLNLSSVYNEGAEIRSVYDFSYFVSTEPILWTSPDDPDASQCPTFSTVDRIALKDPDKPTSSPYFDLIGTPQTLLMPLLMWFARKYIDRNATYYTYGNKSLSELMAIAGVTNSAEVIRNYYSYLLSLFYASVSSALADNFATWPGFVQFAWTLIHDSSSNNPFTYNDLAIRAYWRVVFDWYVDNTLYSTTTGSIYDQYILDVNHNIKNPLVVPSWDESQNHTFDLFSLYKRNFAKDYFTSSFVSPQAGTDVQIPSNGTIAELRQANWLQKLKERLAWIGPRYKDVVKGIFNVDSSDTRLDRVEVLSRKVSSLDIQTIVQTSQGDVNNDLQAALGNLGGMSNTTGGAFGCDYLAEEHGIIMCLVSVRPKVAYQNSVRRELFKLRPYSFLWPQFAQLGEQEVYNKELYLDFDRNLSATVPEDVSNLYKGVFGWQRRYGEYMFDFNEVHGEFRRSMDYWHDSRNFNTMPTLSQEFLEVSPDTNDLNRIFAVVDDENPIYFYSYFDIIAVRALPRYLNYDL